MQLMRTTVAAVVFSFVGQTGASAQQIIPPGQFTIAGTPFNCGNVPTYLYPAMSDIATATPGAINLNWPQFSSVPASVQAFIYAHECAHHLLGSSENAADCWAVKTGRDQGFLAAADVQDICQSVWMSPGDWTHFPGPMRCRNMMMCFSQP